MEALSSEKRRYLGRKTQASLQAYLRKDLQHNLLNFIENAYDDVEILQKIIQN
jgi:hypothetical protein